MSHFLVVGRRLTHCCCQLRFTFRSTFGLSVPCEQPTCFGPSRGSSFVFIVWSWWCVSFFVLVTVIAVCADVMNIKTRCTATQKACAVVGEQWPHTSQSAVIMLLPDIRNPLGQYFFLTTSFTGLRTTVLSLTLSVFCCVFLFYALTSLVVHSVPQCSGFASASSFCFSLSFAFVEVSASRCFLPSVRKASRLTLSSCYRFHAAVWHKLRIVACKK